MITFIIASFAKDWFDASLSRRVFAGILLLLFLSVTVFCVISACKKKKAILVLLAVAFLLEAVVALQYSIPEKDVELAYVATISGTPEVPSENAVWYTVYSEKANVNAIEKSMSCDFSDLLLDTEHYTYLFVRGYQDVKLSYSLWDLSFDNLLPPQNAFFVGTLSVNGTYQQDKIFVFRFPHKPIVPHELQWK